MSFRIVHKNTGICYFDKANEAKHFFTRLLGLMFRKSIGSEQALVFFNTSSIHTFFMRFPIDVIFLDRDMAVKRICPSLSPSRVVFCRGAFCVIECRGGEAEKKGIEVNDIVMVKK
ncbi:MAG: DUF192 domain-containing protein [Candidatus Omnitrophota bacterium]